MDRDSFALPARFRQAFLITYPSGRQDGNRKKFSAAKGGGKKGRLFCPSPFEGGRKDGMKTDHSICIMGFIGKSMEPGQLDKALMGRDEPVMDEAVDDAC